MPELGPLAKQTVRVMVYRLRQKLFNPVNKGFSSGAEEKRRSCIYLYNYQLDLLDAIAEAEDKSRNEVVREMVDDSLQELIDSKPAETTAPAMDR